MLVTTTVFAAECKLNTVCSAEDCKALNSKYGIDATSKKCIDPEAGQATSLVDCKDGVTTGTPTTPVIRPEAPKDETKTAPVKGNL